MAVHERRLRAAFVCPGPAIPDGRVGTPRRPVRTGEAAARGPIRAVDHRVRRRPHPVEQGAARPQAAHAQRRSRTAAPPVVPLVANVTARQVSDPDTIRRLLVEQVTGMVRWRESMLYMKEQGVTRVVEIGAGKVLGGLLRRIDRDLDAVSVGQPDEIEALLKTL